MKAKFRNVVLGSLATLMLASVPLATTAINDAKETVTAKADTVNHADIAEEQNLAHNKWDWSFDQTGAGVTTFDGEKMRMSEISVNDGPYAMYQTNRMDNFKYSMYANMSLKTSEDLEGVPSASTSWDYSTFYISFMVNSDNAYAKYANAMTAETYQKPYFSLCFERNYLTQKYCADCAETDDRTIDSTTGTCKTCGGTNFAEDKKMLQVIRLYRNEGCFGGTADDRVTCVEKTWFEGIEDYIDKDFDYNGVINEKDVQASDVGVNYMDDSYHWFDFEVLDANGGINVNFYYDGTLMFAYGQNNTFTMNNGTSTTVNFDTTTGWIGLWTHSSLSPQPSSVTGCYIDIQQLGIAPITGSTVGSYYEKCPVPDLPITANDYALNTEYVKGEQIEIKLADLFTYEGDEEIVYEFIDSSTGETLGTQANGYWYWTPTTGDYVEVKVTATVQNGDTENPKKATNYLDVYLSGDDVQQLPAPSITIDETTGEATWTTVENATSYLYKIGEDGTETTATKNSAQLKDGETLYVKAQGFGYIDSYWATATYTAPALATPTVTLTKNIAMWQAVENAENGYAYTINGGEEQTTQATYVRGLTHGQTLRVKALGNGSTTRDSAWSAGVTYMASMLSAPVVKIKDGVVSWEKNEDAVKYVYKIGANGEEKDVTGTITLVHGETIYVKAIGDGESYLSSNWSTPQTYNEGALETPTLTLNGNVVSWEAIENASGYVYKIGVNGEEKETTLLSVTLKHGESIKVKAVGTEKEDSYWSSSITYVASVLNTPVVAMSQNVASWSAVENASGYVYKIGVNGEEKETTALSVTLKNGETLYVKALGNGETSLDGAWSSGVVYVASALNVPVVTLNGNVASWNAVDGASGYVYKIGANGTVQTASELSVTLANGETVYVKALGNGETSLDSTWSAGKKYVVVQSNPDDGNIDDGTTDDGTTDDGSDDTTPPVDPEMENVYVGNGEEGCGSVAGALGAMTTMLVAGFVVALKRRGE